MSIDEAVQKSALRRLSIIEGQVRGLRRMVEERKYCVDILTQISAIHEALRGVGKVIVRKTCQRRAPSIAAASYGSRGRESKAA